jgi:hypothetical protein
MNLAEQVDYWMGRYSTESDTFMHMYQEQVLSATSEEIEQAIPLSGYSIALEVTAKGLANIQMQEQVIQNYEEAIASLIEGLQKCIDLNNQNFIVTPKPWISKLAQIQAQARVRQYQEIIEQLSGLL